MSGVIHKLNDELINKIAAGEVVERPASVVKELVENALDAISHHITIAIKDGGKKLIRVTDDGVGISSDELRLAVDRHTTSKIESFDDLYRLKSKGFRGEALASICSVAKVSLASKTQEGESSEILIEGGQVIDQRACAHPNGTSVTVKYLFFQTPARLKFLKSSDTETSHIVDLVTRLALSHPLVGFSLSQDERVLVEAPAHQTLRERAAALLGKELADYLYDFSAEGAGMRLSGLIGHPQIARSQRSHAFFFVNSRAVNDKVIWHAVTEAYRDLLMRGKYPVLVLNLEIDENIIDVNVHPTKSEIRFQNSQNVHRFVFETVRQKLQEAPWVWDGDERTTENEEQSHVSNQSDPSDRSDSSPEPNATDGIRSALTTWGKRYFEEHSVLSEVTAGVRRQQQKKIHFGKTEYSEMNPIGQLLGTYILCETEGKLILIDQHAAHERVGFEKLLLQYQKEGISHNRLLITETFDLKPSDVDILKKYLDELHRFGFEIEFFGGNTFVLKAVPTLLEGRIDVQKLIADLIEDVKATGELVSLKDSIHSVLAKIACHAQIRANHHLGISEIKSLLHELDEYQFTDFCPHGRPVSVEITVDEIEKWFRRVL